MLPEGPGEIWPRPSPHWGFPTRCAWSIHLMHLSLGNFHPNVCRCSPPYSLSPLVFRHVSFDDWSPSFHIPLDLLVDQQKCLPEGYGEDSKFEHCWCWSGSWPWVFDALEQWVTSPGFCVVKKTSEVGWPLLKNQALHWVEELHELRES